MCENGNFDDIMWLYNFLKKNRIKIQNKAFYAVCIKGHIELVKIFIMNNDVDLDEDDYNTYRYQRLTQKFVALRYACHCGNLDIVKYLWHSNNKIAILFEDTFRSRKYEVSRWIYSLIESLEIDNFSEQIYQEILRILCRNGDLDETMWIYNICADMKINISYVTCFSNACYGNNKDLIFWFYDKNIDFTCCDKNYWGDIFIDIFYQGKYNTYEVLNSLCGKCYQSFELDLSRVFSWLCRDGSLNKIKYLMDAISTSNIKIKVDIHFNDCLLYTSDAADE